jgi:hypothetical protein
MGIRKTGKAIDFFVECTLYGFTYDRRKTQVERFTQQQLRELKKDVKRKNNKKNKRSRNKKRI